MSTSSLAHALTPARHDESHSAPLSIPFDQAQGNSYSSMNPLPGLSHHPSAFSPNPVLPADYSIAPGVCDTNYPNYQGHGTVYPPAGFIPTWENAKPSMIHPNFQAPENSYSSTNPLPGLSHHTSDPSPASVFPADYSIAPGVCDTNYPNYQGHGTVCPPAGFIPTWENAEPYMIHPNFQAPENSYSSTNPLPGLSHHTSDPSPASVFPADYSITPGVCDTNHHTNYQGHGTVCPPAGFIPTREGEPPMNHPNFQAPCYSLYNIPEGTATDATVLMLSEYTGDQEQTSLSTYQYGFPTHPQAVPAQQQNGLKYEPQCAKEDHAVKEPQWEPAQVQSENGQTKASHPTLVEPENTKVHSCGNNPRTWCSGNGVICLESLRAFFSKYPRAFSKGKLLKLVIQAIAPEFSQYATGQHSQIDTNDTDQLQSHNVPMWRTGPSGLSATVSTSTPATSESYLSPSDNLVVTPPSMCPVRSQVTGKRKRSVKYPEDPKNRGKSMRARDKLRDDGEPHANITVDDGEKCKKKRKRTDEKLICFICEILEIYYQPLYRREALKHHFLTMHGMFRMLLNDEYSGYRILKSRNLNQLGNLRSLILRCISMQAQARSGGVEIEEEEDIALSQHPDVIAALHRS